MALILIADDSWIARASLKKTLKSLSVDLIEAEDGKSALEIIKSRNPDLILLDLLMPGMDGTDILQIMKDESIKIPAIVFSADIQDSTVKQVKDLGAVDFINKPANPDILLEIIKKTIKVS